jgi:hypothetical protein
MNRRMPIFAAVLALSVSTAGAASAQALPVQIGVGATFESYGFGSTDAVDLDRVTLLAVPVAVRAALTRQVELSLATAYARASLTRGDGHEATVTGPTDTELRLTWASAGDRVRLSGIALLPTGRTELTADEMDVTGVIAADLLPFSLTNWGTGGGVGASAAVAVPVAEGTTVGLSAGYVLAREYEPLEATTFAYRPGNQLLARAAFDHTIGTAGKASLQLTYQQFGSDEADGSNLYQSGDRMQALASYAFAQGARNSGIAYAGYLRRQGGRYAAVSRVTPAQDIVYGGFGMRVPTARAVLTPTVDARIVGNEDGIDQGYVIGLGTGAEFDVGSLVLVPSVRARFGQLTVMRDAESTLTGFEVGLAVRRLR